MKKDRTRDYATAAFRDYSLNGFRRYEETRSEIYNSALLDASLEVKSGRVPETDAIHRAEKAVKEKSAFLLDILAVEKTLDALQKEGKDFILGAVYNVYLVDAKQTDKRSVISERVRRLAVDIPAGEATVYRYLKQARKMFAAFRGLNH